MPCDGGIEMMVVVMVVVVIMMMMMTMSTQYSEYLDDCGDPSECSC